MRKAFKYRLFTDASQERELDIALETHRRLYNAYLDYRELAYSMYGVTLTYIDCSRWFKHQRGRNPFFAGINFSSAQATMRRLDKAFAAFFRRVKAGENPGYPRFKGRDRFDSIEFPAYGDGIKLIGGELRVQHVGMIRIKRIVRSRARSRPSPSSGKPASGTRSSPVTSARSRSSPAPIPRWGSMSVWNPS